MEDRMLSDEILLALIKKAGSGTDDYEDLENKPQIGGTTLIGNKSLGDLGIKNEFVGTLEEWEQLTIEEKKSFDTYQITNDFISGGNFELKIVEYTGTGETQHSINIGENAKYISWFARKDSAVWTNSFIPTQTQVRVIWRTPNSGENNITLSFASGVLTINGVDAGQTMNSEGVDYVLVYFE